MRSLSPSETSRIPDTIQKVVIEFPLPDQIGWIMKSLCGTAVHPKEITSTVHTWEDDPKGWENSWMERVMGLDGPW